MKKVINPEDSPKLEFFKRILYSFQVLMVGVSLPLLFLVGISDGNQKKSAEPEVKEISTTAQVSPKPVIGVYAPGM